MEAAIAKYGPGDRRLRIEHSQIMTEDDLARAVRLGGTNRSTSGVVSASYSRSPVPVIASYQPTHATSDVSVHDFVASAKELSMLIPSSSDVVCQGAHWRRTSQGGLCLADLYPVSDTRFLAIQIGF